MSAILRASLPALCAGAKLIIAIEARITMIVITTSISIRVNPVFFRDMLILKDILENQKLDEVGEIVFYMLREKEVFKVLPGEDYQTDLEKFLDAVSSTQDQINIYMALIGSVGIGEPEMEKIKESLGEATTPGGEPDPKPAPTKTKKKTSGKSSTP